MSKIFNCYIEGETSIDKTWYDSSNIKYSECIDKEGDLKVLKVVFSNGTQYQYEDVKVQDYLLFRESSSQGKDLNRLIKGNKYKYTKLEDADLSIISEDLMIRSKKGFFIYNNDKFQIKNNSEEVVYESYEKLNEKELNMIVDILKSVGLTVKLYE